MASQSASSGGHDNIIVQAAGDGIHVQVGLPYLELIPAARRIRTNPRLEIEILDPVFQAVPLVGRESDLAFLRSWIETDPKIGITALTGAGGSGKTRLSLELLQNLPEHWQGGFLAAQEAKRFLEAKNLASWSWQKPTLIVADYAALFAETLADWFRELADHPTPEHPLRILLLERHAEKDQGWYASLADNSFHGRRVRELFSPLEPIRIAPLTALDQRRSVLSAGLEAAAKLKPNAPISAVTVPVAGTDPWFDQRLADDQWRDPLLLLMAAVIAASSGMHAALKLSRPDLAKQLAKREKARVENSVADRNAKDLLVHLYACVTLCGGLSCDEATTVAEREFAALKMQYPGGPGRATKDLAILLGKQDSLPPLAPDLLGEAFLLTVFAENGSSVVARLGTLAIDRVAATLIRCVQDFSHWGEAAPMHWMEALAAQGERDWGILPAVEAALPKATLALRPLAVSVTQSLLSRTSQNPELSSERAQASLAHLWNNLSLRQSEMGLRAEALASIAEAVRIRRALANADPAAFLPYLAMSLNNQSNRQSDLGQRVEALASIAEAVRHYRALAEANPIAFFPDLAMSLNNQANRERDMGQRAEAFSSIVEAVRHYQALAKANPDAFLPDLAMSLTNQANTQSDMGQRAEALASITEAVRIRRALADANPDAFLPDLAVSVNNLATTQRDVGQRAEALASIVEAVRHYRALAEANPDAFLPNLAASLTNQATMQSAAGQHAEALTSVAEAVSHYRALALSSPDAFISRLAASLNNQSNRQSDIGQHAEALASIGEAVCIRRALTHANRAAFLPDLAMSLNNQAVRQRAMGQHAEALASIAEAVGYHRTLALGNADAFLPDLATSLGVLGDCLAAIERLPEARAAAREALAVLAPFCGRRPPVFDELAKATVRDYVLRTKELGEDPDMELLSPYMHLFAPGEPND
jgi:hypothetical protein